MDLSHLSTLKEKLAAEKSLPSIMEYFLDQFGDHDGFADIGSETKNELVEALLAEASLNWFGKKITPSSLTLVGIPEHNFIHGGCILGANLVNIIYFDDILTALIVLAPGGKYKHAQFMRASARTMPPGYASEN